MVAALEDHDHKYLQKASTIAFSNNIGTLLELVCDLPKKYLGDTEVFPSKICLCWAHEDFN